MDTPAGPAAQGRSKALLAVLSLALPFALWHGSLYKRGGAYLLLDLAAPGRAVAAVHLAALAAGAWLVLRGRAAPPWRPALLLLAFSLGCAAALVGSFFAFASGPSFVAFAFAAAALLGALGGALVAASLRGLSALQFPREVFLDLLRVEALSASLLLALAYLLLAERLGPLRFGLLLALACAFVAHWGLGLIAPRASFSKKSRRVAALACCALASLQLLVEPLTPLRETSPDPVVLAHNAPTGRLVLTSGRGAFQLYAGGMLRASTIDAARRREAAAHPALQAAPRRRRVLLLGGGDGGALREVLRYPDVERVDVVEPEAGLVDLAASQPVLVRENDGALRSPRVALHRGDPVAFLSSPGDPYDVVLVDLLEPEGPRRSKWFTRHFYAQIGERLAPDGVGAVVAGVSPLAQRQAFWCVVSTLEAAGFKALPYRAQLPTMGPWGHVLFARSALAVPPSRLPGGLLYLDDFTLPSLFALAPDEGRVEAEVNLLHHQVLLRYRGQPL